MRGLVAEPDTDIPRAFMAALELNAVIKAPTSSAAVIDTLAFWPPTLTVMVSAALNKTPAAALAEVVKVVVLSAAPAGSERLGNLPIKALAITSSARTW